MNKKFEIVVFRQSRTLVCVFLSPVILIGTLFIGASIKSFPLNILISIFIISSVFVVFYYFTIGYLQIEKTENSLIFNWKRKLIFNYKEIKPVRIEEIKTLVIDDIWFLRKIITSNREININNGKLFLEKSKPFVSMIITETRNVNGRVINSWEVLKEKNYLKIIYIINSVVLASVLIISIYYVIQKGFSQKILLFIPLVISQLFIYQKIIKENSKKLKK